MLLVHDDAGSMSIGLPEKEHCFDSWTKPSRCRQNLLTPAQATEPATAPLVKRRSMSIGICSEPGVAGMS